MVRNITLIILLSLAMYGTAQTTDTAISYECFITVVEEGALFNGSLISFIQSNIDYPQTALDDSIAGVVYVEFMIEKDATTSNHRIVRGIRKDLDDEVLRVTRLIKFDKPAMQRGKPMKELYGIQIKFELPMQHSRCKEK